MFSDTRKLLRGLSAPHLLVWLMLIAGMVLFIGGLLPLAWPTAWHGAGLIALGVVVMLFLPRDRAPSDARFRSGVFMSGFLTTTVGLLIFVPLLAFSGLVIGLIDGFRASLVLACLRMLAMLLALGFVTGIPRCARIGDRS